jgi:hypothetical protein
MQIVGGGGKEGGVRGKGRVKSAHKEMFFFVLFVLKLKLL